ncbi:hypothetical protein AB0873_09540 [Micromonospora sp. NPDC047707]|uniref:hypothetical protein n=1 Tax=Micromonospora sp. NPDC047707 TaxID=3154498 RepID=UPI0034527CCC
MTVNVGALHAAAIGVATELTVGECDLDIVAALVADVPDEIGFRLILLISTFIDIFHAAGPEALHAAGVHAARLQLEDGG